MLSDNFVGGKAQREGRGALTSLAEASASVQIPE